MRTQWASQENKGWKLRTMYKTLKSTLSEEAMEKDTYYSFQEYSGWTDYLYKHVHMYIKTQTNRWRK